MSHWSEKAKLVVFGALLMLMGDLMVRQYRPVAARYVPCAPTTFAERPRELKARRAPGRTDGEFRPRIAKSAIDSDPSPLDLKNFQRVQHVGPAGSRDLFRYVIVPERPQRPSAAPPVQTAQIPVLNVVAQSESTAHSTRPIFYYGYSRRRGSPLL